MHNMDWNDLRYFLAISRAGTLAGAARSLHVQHSTVGRRLDALESALGATLFTRTPDGFVLSEAGAEVLPLAEEAERSLHAFEQRVVASDSEIEGIVRLTVSEAFSGFIVRRMSELQARHPGLIVEILSANRNFDLARREADLALRSVSTTQADLTCKRIGDAGWSMYGATDYVERFGLPQSPENLAGHRIIGFDETLANTPGGHWLDAHGASANVVLRGNSIISVLNATIVGMGISVLPCFLAEPEPTLRRVTPKVLASREIWLVFHPDVARIARVRKVIDFVAEIVGREAVLLGGETASNLAESY